MAYYFVKKKKRISKKVRKTIGGFIVLCGIAILLYFFFPLLSYQMFVSSPNVIATPVPKHARVESSTIGSLITQGFSHLTTNYNDVRNWYPKTHFTNDTSVSTYLLSIPKLKIQDAEVSTVDYDLAKHLIQYAGTSIPGQNGTAVIFGHSTLPQWFDPKDYKAIFATLHQIKNGDEVVAKINGVTYLYKVFSVTVTVPEDTNIFSQSYDHSYITIVTCTPPGTVWKRLIVRAALSETEENAINTLPTKRVLAGNFIY